MDNSFCAAHILPDEEVDYVTAFFTEYQNNGDDEIIVPHLFWYEMSNILKTSFKRKRISADDADSAFDKLNAYDFTTDSALGSDYAKTLLALAKRYDLSAYDAAYLELAIRKQAKLATLDDALKAAAEKAGVETV
jgi:predicted nucleic acid-binding protein